MNTPFGPIVTDGRPSNAPLADVELVTLRRLGDALQEIVRAVRQCRTVRDAKQAEELIERVTRRDRELEMEEAAELPNASEPVIAATEDHPAIYRDGHLDADVASRLRAAYADPGLTLADLELDGQ